jgi:hypothetical protein
MPRSEKSILNEALILGTAEPRTMLYRQNTGMAWQGRRVSRAPGAMLTVERGMVILQEARPIDFGVPGAGDLVGVSGGIPIQGEGKTLTGPHREAQLRFQRAWETAGGRYILFRSPEEFLSKLRGE